MRKFTLSPDRPTAVQRRSARGTRIVVKIPKGVSVKWATANRKRRSTGGGLSFPTSPTSLQMLSNGLRASLSFGNTLADFRGLHTSSSMPNLPLLLGGSNDASFDDLDQTEVSQADAHEFVDFSQCEDDEDDEAASILRESARVTRDATPLDTPIVHNFRPSRQQLHDFFFPELPSSVGLSETFQDETLAEGLDKKGMKVYQGPLMIPTSTQGSPVYPSSMSVERFDSPQALTGTSSGLSCRRSATATNPDTFERPNKRHCVASAGTDP